MCAEWQNTLPPLLDLDYHCKGLFSLFVGVSPHQRTCTFSQYYAEVMRVLMSCLRIRTDQERNSACAAMDPVWIAWSMCCHGSCVDSLAQHNLPFFNVGCGLLPALRDSECPFGPLVAAFSSLEGNRVHREPKLILLETYQLYLRLISCTRRISTLPLGS